MATTCGAAAVGVVKAHIGQVSSAGLASHDCAAWRNPSCPGANDRRRSIGHSNETLPTRWQGTAPLKRVFLDWIALKLDARCKTQVSLLKERHRQQKETWQGSIDVVSCV